MLKPTHLNLCFALLVTILWAGACADKDAPEPDGEQFPIEVKATAVESQGAVRVFTRDGEVTDETVIAMFIAGVKGFNESFQIESTDIITFSTDSTAGFNLSAVLYRVRMEQGNKLVFRSPFLLPLDMHPLLRQFSLDEHRIAKSNILQTVPSVIGYTHIGEQVRVAEGSYGSFLMPTTIYKLSRRLGHGEYEASHELNSGVFSEFNETFLQTLLPRDTIAYQEHTVRFKK